MDLSKKETCPLAFFRFTVCVFSTSELKTRRRVPSAHLQANVSACLMPEAWSGQDFSRVMSCYWSGIFDRTTQSSAALDPTLRIKFLQD